MRLLNAVGILIVVILFLLAFGFAVGFALFVATSPSANGFAFFVAFTLAMIAFRAALKWLLERYGASSPKPWR